MSRNVTSSGKIILHKEIPQREDISDVSPFSTLKLMKWHSRIRGNPERCTEMTSNTICSTISRYREKSSFKFPAFLKNSQNQKHKIWGKSSFKFPAFLKNSQNQKHKNIQLYLFDCAQNKLSHDMSMSWPLISSLSPSILSPCLRPLCPCTRGRSSRRCGGSGPPWCPPPGPRPQ